MENSTSKHEVLKPVILKAGVPLAVSFAGFVYAWFVAKKSLSKTSSLSPNGASSHESDSHHDPSYEESCHSHSLSCMEDEGNSTTLDESVVAESFLIPDIPCLEEEINGLRSRIEGMQMKELALRLQFDRYCGLKEQEMVVGEIKNMLSLETARVDFLDREISSVETQNRRLESFAAQYLRVVEQIERLKSENRMLRRKFQKLTRKSKAQTRVAKEQALKIKMEEEEILRSRDALETKVDVIGKLEDKMEELKRDLDQLQNEKNELLKKLDTAEKSHASRIEGGDVSREEYKQVVDELEQMKKERADEAKELIYLRWTNACLRHDLKRPHEQQQDQDKIHSELEFGRNDVVIHYDSEHELHSDPSFDEHRGGHDHSDSGSSKRTKLLERLKRWVEGSEKARVRHSVSKGTEENVVPRRKSCSSA
ncbi:protein CHUP1, chloroplastic isoform X2 [Vigna radiata var. radiata]|uniref:Protein CHUP1, chloroplastic isoform X2 n=1 Tax=Vigna radiata var. radiata TaxID=3916 RepID=A0A1S3TNT2_VIGRR|nr:protein CHUP1, chloroplastic isoform X2 [Vigna radiata var. radiata]